MKVVEVKSPLIKAALNFAQRGSEANKETLLKEIKHFVRQELRKQYNSRIQNLSEKKKGDREAQGEETFFASIDAITKDWKDPRDYPKAIEKVNPQAFNNYAMADRFATLVNSMPNELIYSSLIAILENQICRFKIREFVDVHHLGETKVGQALLESTAQASFNANNAFYICQRWEAEGFNPNSYITKIVKDEAQVKNEFLLSKEVKDLKSRYKGFVEFPVYNPKNAMSNYLEKCEEAVNRNHFENQLIKVVTACERFYLLASYNPDITNAECLAVRKLEAIARSGFSTEKARNSTEHKDLFEKRPELKEAFSKTQKNQQVAPEMVFKKLEAEAKQYLTTHSEAKLKPSVFKKFISSLMTFLRLVSKEPVQPKKEAAVLTQHIAKETENFLKSNPMLNSPESSAPSSPKSHFRRPSAR